MASLTGKEKREPKYWTVFVHYRDGIVSNRYTAGTRLPSEHEIAAFFGVSRPTVRHALDQLEQSRLVTRLAGSGTYVSAAVETVAAPNSTSGTKTLGLLLPGLGQGEIFEPICNQIMFSAQEHGFRVCVGNTIALRGKKDADRGPFAEELCRQYIDQKVDGVFLQPLELAEGAEEVNHRILNLLRREGIAVVLIDCDYVDFPKRSEFDLVGIDNFRAGTVLAEHVLATGAKNIHFIAREGSAATIRNRWAGVRETLLANGIPVDGNRFHTINDYEVEIPQLMSQRPRPDALICGNDHTAALVLQALSWLDVRIPQDVRVTGVDNLRYATLLSVPLTTIYQPCEEMGRQALRTMMERITNPGLATRDIRLGFKLIVRESTVARK